MTRSRVDTTPDQLSSSNDSDSSSDDGSSPAQSPPFTDDGSSSSDTEGESSSFSESEPEIVAASGRFKIQTRQRGRTTLLKVKAKLTRRVFCMFLH